MDFKIVDEVEVREVELNDVLCVLDEVEDDYVFIQVTGIEDEEQITISGHEVGDDERTFEVTFDPFDEVNLYMVVDEVD